MWNSIARNMKTQMALLLLILGIDASLASEISRDQYMQLYKTANIMLVVTVFMFLAVGLDFLWTWYTEVYPLDTSRNNGTSKTSIQGSEEQRAKKKKTISFSEKASSFSEKRRSTFPSIPLKSMLTRCSMCIMEHPGFTCEGKPQTPRASTAASVPITESIMIFPMSAGTPLKPVEKPTPMPLEHAASRRLVSMIKGEKAAKRQLQKAEQETSIDVEGTGEDEYHGHVLVGHLHRKESCHSQEGEAAIPVKYRQHKSGRYSLLTASKAKPRDDHEKADAHAPRKVSIKRPPGETPSKEATLHEVEDNPSEADTQSHQNALERGLIADTMGWSHKATRGSVDGETGQSQAKKKATRPTGTKRTSTNTYSTSVTTEALAEQEGSQLGQDGTSGPIASKKPSSSGYPSGPHAKFQSESNEASVENEGIAGEQMIMRMKTLDSSDPRNINNWSQVMEDKAVRVSIHRVDTMATTASQQGSVSDSNPRPLSTDGREGHVKNAAVEEKRLGRPTGTKRTSANTFGTSEATEPNEREGSDGDLDMGTEAPTNTSKDPSSTGNLSGHASAPESAGGELDTDRSSGFVGVKVHHLDEVTQSVFGHTGKDYADESSVMTDETRFRQALTDYESTIMPTGVYRSSASTLQSTVQPHTARRETNLTGATSEYIPDEEVPDIIVENVTREEDEESHVESTMPQTGARRESDGTSGSSQGVQDGSEIPHIEAENDYASTIDHTGVRRGSGGTYSSSRFAHDERDSHQVDGESVQVWGMADVGRGSEAQSQCIADVCTRRSAIESCPHREPASGGMHVASDEPQSTSQGGESNATPASEQDVAVEKGNPNQTE